MKTNSEASRSESDHPSDHVLRLGVIQNGNIIEERLLRRAGKVTVGSSPRNTIVVPGAALPARSTIFEVDRQGRPTLQLDAVEQGRISVGGRLETLSGLRGAGRRVLSLDRDSRGKLQLGEVTLLFQLVQAPPEAPRAKLPPSVRGGVVTEMNWIMAASFIGVALVQAAFVIYLRTLDPPLSDLGQLKALAGADWEINPYFKPPLDPTKMAQEGEAAIKKVPKPEQTKPGKTPATRRPGRTKAKPCGPACKKRRLALIKQQIMRSGVIALLTHKGKGPGSTAADLIGRGKPSTSTDKAFAKVGGLTVASRGSSLTTRDGSHGPRGPVDIDSLGGRISGPDSVQTGGGGPRERVPQAVVTPDRKRIVCILPMNQVAHTIRRGMPAVRTCYQRALKRDRGLAGKLTMRLSVDPMGKVTAVDFDSDTLSDPLVTRCITGYARRWRFPQSSDGGSDVTVPLVLRAATR
jgi:hypothetical protein